MTYTEKLVTTEMCPHCDTEVEISAYGISKCPNCDKEILPCGMCAPCKEDCPYNHIEYKVNACSADVLRYIGTEFDNEEKTAVLYFDSGKFMGKETEARPESSDFNPNVRNRCLGIFASKIDPFGCPAIPNKYLYDNVIVRCFQNGPTSMLDVTHPEVPYCFCHISELAETLYKLINT